MKKQFIGLITIVMPLVFAACAGSAVPGNPAAEPTASFAEAEHPDTPVPTADTDDPIESVPTQAELSETDPKEEDEQMQMKINDVEVTVEWENNASAEALKQLAEQGPLIIRMSMYGGFEQVGPIGTQLPRNDVQTTTSAGDIVLYAGNQMVVFYGSNTWAYTRLGRITDKTPQEMADLLENGDVTVTIRIGG